MATYTDLITRAYQLSGVLGEGEAMSGAQSVDGLSALNELIDAWNADNMNIYTLSILQTPTIAGKTDYTVGIGGDFNITRPPQLEGAWIRQNTAPSVDLPIIMVSLSDWGNIRSKNTSGSIVQYAYYDQNYPLATLKVWPVPMGGTDLIIHANALLNSTVTLIDVVSLPPAYVRAIRYHLAIALSVENGLDPLASLLNTAASAKQLLEANNGQAIQRLRFDSQAMGAGHGRYDVQSDSVRVR